MFRVFDAFNRFEAFAVNGLASLLKRIEAMFSSSDGVWIEFGDASQLNELYDQTGDVPAIGDSVGYVADQSGNGNHAAQPVSNSRPTYGGSGVKTLGPEQVINGGFDTDTDWVLASDATIEGGTLNLASTLISRASQASVFEAGQAYQVTWTVTDSAGARSIVIEAIEDGSRQTIQSFSNNVGSYSATFIADYPDLRIMAGSGSGTASIDNVSVKEVTEWDTYYLEFDGLGDDLLFTPTAISDANWIVATPYGTQISRFPVEAIEQPVPQSRELIGFQILEPLSEAQRQTVLDYWASKGAGEEVGAVWTTDDTTIYHVYGTTNGPYEIQYFGANGATTTSTSTSATVDVAAAGLTAPVVVVVPKALMSDDDLTTWRSDSNDHDGLLPDISGLVNLNFWNSSGNNHTGPLPDISELVKLQVWNSTGSNHTGPLPDISGLDNLTDWYSSYNNHTGPLPDISGLVELETLYCHFNNHDGWLGGTIPPATKNIQLNNNALDESAVNGILVAVEANGTFDGKLYLNSGSNAVPTGAGLTAYNALVARGWDVRVAS